MTFETREQVLEKILESDKPDCPHCGEEMTLWEVPPINFGDGLGWGTPYLYVCFNDDCDFYKEGWNWMEKQFGQHASYRFMINPSSGASSQIPVWSDKATREMIVEENEVNEE